jgi:hypothetical protein
MHIHKDHVSRKEGNGIGETVLHAVLTRRLQAQLDNGANVPLNDV